MNDPWDVKSVRQSSYYTSCMKLNGVPLLPPVLSKECRKEMQYYKLLAKEVEKRILLLKPFTSSSDSDPNEDKTDAPELPESEQNYEFPLEEITSFANEKVLNTDNEKSINHSFPTSPKFSSMSTNNSEKNTSNLSPITDTALNETSKLAIDLSFSLNQSVESTMHDNKAKVKDTILDIPEHDSETPQKPKEKHPPETEITKNVIKEERVDKSNFRIDTKDKTVDELLCYIYHDGPASLSVKSFTGSLNNLHKDSVNNTQTNPLIRQRSYTVLTPSPLLLAHLQIQSMSTGVDMTSISMSESLSNLSSPNKKRRSWDLETAKAKWSNMALELNKKNISVNVAVSKNSDNKYTSSKKRVISNHDATKTPSTMPRSKSVGHRAMAGYGNSTSKPKSDSIQRNRRNRSPTRNINDSQISQQKPISKEISTVPTLQKTQLISECEDPGRRVRELYERIQKQQLMQMATLVEKQKKEQMLLQQVFEEQNSLLYNQLKTICPKTPGEVKEAWIDKNESPERGPVSLSQLIDTKQTPLAVQDSPASCTLTDTKNYLNRCDNVLKKSRDITGSIKKLQQDSRSENDRPKVSAIANGDGGKVRTRSPKGRNLNTSRKLTYETSASSDRDYELILTDRTNDTMADVNVTFPSDHSDAFRPGSPNSHVMSHLCGKAVISVHQTPVRTKEVPCRSSESAIRCVEDTIKNSILDVRARFYKRDMLCAPTAHERAAATKIVAYAKGYLVRRLMKTERVQSTVQTIRDALLCALQLHQDREGIRGPDVDLHRRLIQQITAACYTLHDTFVGSTPAERCALLAADRSRRRALSLRPVHQPAAHQRHYRPTDIMSHSHTGSFPQRARRSSPGPGPGPAMTQSHHGAGGAAVGYMTLFVPSVGNDRTPPETRSGAKSFSGEKAGVRARCVDSPRRRPWR